MKDKTTNIYVEPSLINLSTLLTESFTALAQHTIQQQGCFHAAFSGGNTPQVFFRQLALKKNIDWQHIHLYVCDERFVARTHPDSNAGALQDCLTKHISIPEDQLHFISTENITPIVSAENYGKTLDRYLPKDSNGHPQFDFMLLGTAGDGHIASLFPETDGLTVADKLAIPVYVKKLQSWRITLTFPMINQTKNLAFIVTGEQKLRVVKRVFAKTHPPCPIQMIKPAGKVEWYLDAPICD